MNRADDVAAGREVARMLGLEPLPQEGGLFARVATTEHLTTIHFMVIDKDFSALHRLTATEPYFFHAGSPLRLLLLEERGPREVLLGPDPVSGQVPQVTVPAGVWQGSSSAGAWTLVSTVVTPGFDWQGFELGDRTHLTDAYPDFGDRIRELTRRAV